MQTQTVDGRIKELERRQEAKGWNRDRAWQIGKLKNLRDGRMDKVYCIRKSEQGAFAVHTDSITERLFAAKSREAGWRISKRGWPDFFMWRNGKLACVEVKGDLESLRPNQKAVLEALAAYGVPCFTWRPLEGFKRVTGKEVIQAMEAAI